MARQLNLDEAEVNLRRASNAGHPRADGALAALDALRIETDAVTDLSDSQHKELVTRLRSGVQSGDPAAAYMLGRAMYNGYLGLSKDQDTGHALMMRAGRATEGEYFYGPAAAYYSQNGKSLPHTIAAAEAGVVEEQLWLGKHLTETGSDVEGLGWLHVAADAGNVHALIRLAEISYNGRCGQPVSKENSYHYAVRANATGQPEGVAELAMHYILGVGVDANQELGVRLLQDTSTRTENNEAIYLLAICYINGWGVQRDIETAKTWLRRTREYPKAQRMLFRIEWSSSDFTTKVF